jgi:hypothetical protein
MKSKSTKKTGSFEPQRDEKTASCCSSFWAELNPFQPWHLVMDSSGYKIDVVESFAPSGPLTILGKIVMTGIALGTLFVSLLSTSSLSFFFAYFTNLSLLVTIVYLLLSFTSSMFPSRIQQPSEKITGLAKWTWIIFVAGVHGQFMASLLWWVTVYVPGETKLSFVNISTHGVVMFLALIDGVVLNRIPLRLMHWWGYILPTQVLYVIWSVLHWRFALGNPNVNDEDPETNDDAIYSVLAWGEDEWITSTLLSVAVVLVAGPFVYLYMWCLARFPYVCCTGNTRLHYINHRSARNKAARNTDVEEGSRYRLFGGK